MKRKGENSPRDVKRPFLSPSCYEKSENLVGFTSSDLDSSQPDDVTIYQKHAIYRQMKMYKRMYDDSVLEMVEKDRESALLDNLLHEIWAYWNMATDEIKALEALITGVPDQIKGNESENHSIEKMLRSGSSQSELQKKWNAMQATCQLLRKNISTSNTQSSNSHPGSDELGDLNRKLSLQSKRIYEVQAQFDTLKSRYEKSQLKYDMVKEELRNLEKKYDRLQTEKKKEMPVDTPQPKQMEVVPQTVIQPQDDNSAELLELKTLADSRLSEINLLREERIKLVQDITALHLSITNIPEERIIESPHVKSLESSVEYYRAKYEEYKALYEKSWAEIEEMKGNKRKYIEEIAEEEKSRRKELEDECKRLETDLGRVRMHRDSLLNNNVPPIQKSESEARLSKERKKKIEVLESEIKRLKMEIAAGSGLAYLLKSISEGLDSEYVSTMEAKLSAYGHLSEDVQKDLERYVSVYGDTFESDMTVLLKSKEKKIKELELQVNFHEKTKDMLMKEMETMGISWQALEEDKQKSVNELAQKSEQITKLALEKSKYEQKSGLLQKQTAVVSNNMIALKKQNEKQMEQIRKLEEREKNLSQQMVLLDKDGAGKDGVIERTKLKVSEIMHERDVVKAMLVKYEKDALEAISLLKERDKALENEIHASKRLSEQISVLKKKLNAVTSTSSGDKAQEELRDLKMLVKCGSCNLRLKDTTILRCMHCFCKECVDDVYNTRQRKCPICGVGFGREDIKQIFL